MTLPPRPTYSCLGKEQFHDKAIAESAAQRIARRVKNRVSTYRCAFCHAWHVGSGIVPKRARSHLSKRGTPR